MDSEDNTQQETAEQRAKREKAEAKRAALLEPIEDTLDFISVPLNLKAKDGSMIEYTINELPGGERDKYMDVLNGRQVVGKDGVARLRSFDGLQAELITRCVKDKAGRSVAAAVVQGWPSHVQERVFKRCQEINELAIERDEAKN